MMTSIVTTSRTSNPLSFYGNITGCRFIVRNRLKQRGRVKEIVRRVM